MENFVLHQHTKIELPASVLNSLFARMVAATDVTPTAQYDVPAIGESWPDTRGGMYAGILRVNASLRYHLIVGHKLNDFGKMQWGAQGTEIEGADSKWDGLANTRRLLDSGLDLPAVKAAAGSGALDEDAWYLPAQRELALCWANVPDIFETDDWYWSSTQFSAHNAWLQHVSLGYQDIIFKGSTGRVRPVRRLIIR